MVSRRGLFGWVAAALAMPVAFAAKAKPPLGYPGNPVIGVPLPPGTKLGEKLFVFGKPSVQHMDWRDL